MSMPEYHEELVRTTITLPKRLKHKMASSKTNWSQLIREFIALRMEEEAEPNTVEAVLLNERIRRPAPEGWSSMKVIKEWRRKH